MGLYPLWYIEVFNVLVDTNSLTSLCANSVCTSGFLSNPDSFLRSIQLSSLCLWILFLFIFFLIFCLFLLNPRAPFNSRNDFPTPRYNIIMNNNWYHWKHLPKLVNRHCTDNNLQPWIAQHILDKHCNRFLK